MHPPLDQVPEQRPLNPRGPERARRRRSTPRTSAAGLAGILVLACFAGLPVAHAANVDFYLYWFTGCPLKNTVGCCLPASSLLKCPLASPQDLQESFDDGEANGWSLSGLWHVSGCRSHSPTQSLGYNRGGCPTDFDLGRTFGEAVSPPFQVPAAPAQLVWQSWHATEAGPTADRKLVQLSVYSDAVESDSTWTTVWQEDGPQSAWNARAADLSAFSGLTAHVRFFFDSQDGVTNGGEGWYIDDVVVESTLTGP